MAKQAHEYHDMNVPTLEKIRAAFAAHGIKLQSDSGSTSAPMGLTIGWNFDNGNMLLTITVEGSSLWMGMAWSKINSIIDPCLDATGRTES